MPIDGAPLWSGGRSVTVIVRGATSSPFALLPAASDLPAKRASRIDPSEALRAD